MALSDVVELGLGANYFSEEEVAEIHKDVEAGITDIVDNKEALGLGSFPHKSFQMAIS